MTGPLDNNLAGIARHAVGGGGEVADAKAISGNASRDAAGFASRMAREDGPTPAASANAGEQIRSMLATIDSLGASRSQQRAALEQEVRRLEGLATDDPARNELANTKLLATLQSVQEVSFRVELATKVVDQVANGIRTVSQTQV